MPLTTRCRELLWKWAVRGEINPTNFYIALVTSASIPTSATKTFSELTEIAAGNGYTQGGYELTPGVTDFNSIVVDDPNFFVDIGIKNIAWTASGGPIPASGDPARYWVMTTDSPILTSREIMLYGTLGADRVVTAGNSLTLIGTNIRERAGSVINSVQGSTISLSGGTTTNTATISAVGAKYALSNLGTSSTSGSATASDLGVRLALTNPTTITATRGTSSQATVTAFLIIDYF